MFPLQKVSYGALGAEPMQNLRSQNLGSSSANIKLTRSSPFHLEEEILPPRMGSLNSCEESFKFLFSAGGGGASYSGSLTNKKEWSSDTGYNRDKPWKHDARWKSQTRKKNAYCMVPFIWNILKRQIHRDRKYLCVWQSVGEGGV